MKASPAPLSLARVSASERIAAFWGELHRETGSEFSSRMLRLEIRRASALRRAHDRRRALLASWDSAVEAFRVYEASKVSPALGISENQAFGKACEAYRRMDSIRLRASRLKAYGRTRNLRPPFMVSPLGAALGN